MKRRRKFELLVGDLKEVLADPDVEDRYGVLYGLTHDVFRFVDELCGDPAKAAMLIDMARAARQARGPGRDGAEEKLLQRLDYLVRCCCDAFDAVELNSFLLCPTCEGCPEGLDIACRIMRDVCAYGLDCFTFKKARDQFAGTRRACALRILGSASWVFEIPEAVPLALTALKRNRIWEARGAICFLEDYFKAREGMRVPREVVDALLSVVDRTDNRSNATGALNVLVVAGHISELGALDRLDDWKDRQYR